MSEESNARRKLIIYLHVERSTIGADMRVMPRTSVFGTGFALMVATLALASAGCGTGSNEPAPVVDARVQQDAPKAVCGDGICVASEAANCPADCGGGNVCNNNGTCDAGEMGMQPPCGDCPVMGCDNDGVCEAQNGETSATCANDCGGGGGGTCNMNGMCEAGEDMASCIDCGGLGVTCGGNADCTQAGTCCLVGACLPGTAIGDFCVPGL